MPDNEDPQRSIVAQEVSPNAFSAFKGAMQAIREQPMTFGVGVAGLIGGSRFAFAGRLYHAAARGVFMQQIQNEVSKLIDQGSINDAYLKSDQAHACFSDLLNYIDNISPDPKRYEAIKTAFLKTLTQGRSEENNPYAQQLFRVICELTAGEVIVLATIYSMGWTPGQSSEVWLSDVANQSRLLRTELVQEIEVSLVNKRLIFPRTTRIANDVASGTILMFGQRNRLTVLGQEACEKMIQAK